MRRLLAAIIVVLAGALALLAGPAGGNGPSGTYLVRAVFDNGGFVVAGEQVRVAGANIGTVQSVDVSMPGQTVSLSPAPHAIPGKAVVVLAITDPGFKDFRSDASCLIRPQSLIGEKYIDCSPTQPRAPGTPTAPPLTTVPSGQPGAGQHLLPLENNGKAVDLDLVQDIQRLPFAERFRLIINDLGAGLAARGADLADIVRRSDPALRETDQVLGILASQNHQLAKLASDSDTVLAPLARERAHVAGFITSAGATAQATAEQGGALQASLQKFPGFLTQLRLTMNNLRGFSDQAQPVVAQLGQAAPSLSVATQELVPFSSAATGALKSLGRAAVVAGPKLRAANPILKTILALARAAASPSSNLGLLLGSLRQTKGFERLMDLIYNSAGSVNGFDQYGHFLRANLIATNCVDYVTTPLSGCSANFIHRAGGSAAPTSAQLARILRAALRRNARRGGRQLPAPLQKPKHRPSTHQQGSPPRSIRGANGVLDYLLAP